MQTPRPARRTARAGRVGEPEAVRLHGRFEYFYLQEYPKVVALAYALSGSGAGAEDIAQEAFLRAYRDWDRVGSYEHQAAWVRRVAANLATSGLRRRLIEARALTRQRELLLREAAAGGEQLLVRPRVVAKCLQQDLLHP